MVARPMAPSDMRVVCQLGSIVEEIARKSESMVRPAGDLEPSFLAACQVRLDPGAAEDVAKALAFARSTAIVDEHQGGIQAYLSHPIRVAGMTLSMQVPASAETVQLALLHNVFEVCALSEADITTAGISSRVAQGIRLQTVDRERQWDEGYLQGYYAAIEAFGPDLALVKCLDKLDNFLGMALIDDIGPTWSRYIVTGHRFVGPMAHRLSEQLGRFADDLVAHLLAHGSDPVLGAQYRAFLATTHTL
jgi:(p)ppGpp synthase/HD superfamily hydrolase